MAAASRAQGEETTVIITRNIYWAFGFISRLLNNLRREDNIISILQMTKLRHREVM